MLNILLSGVVVLVTHALEAITGFGCTVLAMPFLTSLLGMKTGVMMATVIAWILALYIVVTKRNQIVWKQAGTIILCMLFGLPVGMYLFRNGDAVLMKRILAVFIILVSMFQLGKLVWFPQKTPKEAPKGMQKIVYGLLLVIGGVVHGMFSSGGPLVVLYASRAVCDRHQFRATLCVVWATLNTIIIASYFVPGTAWTMETTHITLAMLPFLCLGIIAGEIIHNKVNARTFSLIVFSMLLLTGIIMIISR